MVGKGVRFGVGQFNNRLVNARELLPIAFNSCHVAVINGSSALYFLRLARTGSAECILWISIQLS